MSSPTVADIRKARRGFFKRRNKKTIAEVMRLLDIEARKSTPDPELVNAVLNPKLSNLKFTDEQLRKLGRMAANPAIAKAIIKNPSLFTQVVNKCDVWGAIYLLRNTRSTQRDFVAAKFFYAPRRKYSPEQLFALAEIAININREATQHQAVSTDAGFKILDFFNTLASEKNSKAIAAVAAQRLQALAAMRMERSNQEHATKVKRIFNIFSNFLAYIEKDTNFIDYSRVKTNLKTLLDRFLPEGKIRETLQAFHRVYTTFGIDGGFDELKRAGTFIPLDTESISDFDSEASATEPEPLLADLLDTPTTAEARATEIFAPQSPDLPSPANVSDTPQMPPLDPSEIRAEVTDQTTRTSTADDEVKDQDMPRLDAPDLGVTYKKGEAYVAPDRYVTAQGGERSPLPEDLDVAPPVPPDQQASSIPRRRRGLESTYSSSLPASVVADLPMPDQDQAAPDLGVSQGEAYVAPDRYVTAQDGERSPLPDDLDVAPPEAPSSGSSIKASSGLTSATDTNFTEEADMTSEIEDISLVDTESTSDIENLTKDSSDLISEMTATLHFAKGITLPKKTEKMAINFREEMLILISDLNKLKTKQTQGKELEENLAKIRKRYQKAIELYQGFTTDLANIQQGERIYLQVEKQFRFKPDQSWGLRKFQRTLNDLEKADKRNGLTPQLQALLKELRKANETIEQSLMFIGKTSLSSGKDSPGARFHMENVQPKNIYRELERVGKFAHHFRHELAALVPPTPESTFGMALDQLTGSGLPQVTQETRKTPKVKVTDRTHSQRKIKAETQTPERSVSSPHRLQ